MTPIQERVLERLREQQVGFPPLYEGHHGNVEALLVDSFGRRDDGFPTDFELRLVVIAPDGSVLEERNATYSVEG